MGHLPIVNQLTVANVMGCGYISTRGKLDKMWEKTTADIFSDILATRKDDFVFPWITAGEGKKNIGFKYIFKISGPPIFVQGDKYPVKVPLDTQGWEYENPLSEAKALELWDKEILWNAIGKKSLRRGRSLTHQTPMEDEKLIDLLNSINPSGPAKIKLQKKIYSHSLPITINTTRLNWDSTILENVKKYTAGNRLSHLDLNRVAWRNDNLFRIEKSLEAWIMENIDKQRGKEFREQILDPKLDVSWFANYLPYGVAGSNMDVVVLQEGSSKKLATVIELKVSSLSAKGFLDASRQVLMYCEFIKRAFRAFGEDIETNGCIISGPSRLRESSRSTANDLDVKWITYHIDNSNRVRFDHFLP